MRCEQRKCATGMALVPLCGADEALRKLLGTLVADATTARKKSDAVPGTITFCYILQNVSEAR